MTSAEQQDCVGVSKLAVLVPVCAAVQSATAGWPTYIPEGVTNKCSLSQWHRWCRRSETAEPITVKRDNSSSADKEITLLVVVVVVQSGRT